MKRRGRSILILSAVALLSFCLGVNQTRAEQRRLPQGHLENALQARLKSNPNFMKREVRLSEDTGTLPAKSNIPTRSQAGSHAKP